MHKLITLLLFSTFLMTGCTKTALPEDNPSSREQIAELTRTIEQLREDNSRLQQERTLEKEQVDGDQIRNNLRETLNMTFKLLAAMNSGDITYIKSVLSPNVKLSENKNELVIQDGDWSFKSAFIRNIQWNDFEFRGYEQIDAEHFRLFVARNITTPGSEGNISYEFSFVRSSEGDWLFDGFIS